MHDGQVKTITLRDVVVIDPVVERQRRVVELRILWVLAGIVLGIDELELQIDDFEDEEVGPVEIVSEGVERET